MPSRNGEYEQPTTNEIEREKEKHRNTTINYGSQIPVKIITLNVRGLKKKNKLLKLREKLKYELGADIILLQETHCNSKDDFKLWCFQVNMIGDGSATSSRRVGVAILVRHNYFENIEFIDMKDGRSIYMKATRNNEKWLVACIYASNKPQKRVEFFRNLNFLDLDLNTFDVVIVGGDFNITLYRKDKPSATEKSKDPSKAALETLIFQHALCDPYNRRNPVTSCLSWANSKSASRIDYLLTNQDLDSRISIIKYIEAELSDHKACFMQIEPLISIKRGRGLWKLNARLLKVKEWRKEGEKLIKKIYFMEEENPKYGVQWEKLKYRSMIISKKWGIKLQNRNKKEKERLEFLLENQEKLLMACDKNSWKRIWRRREYLRKKLKHLNDIQFKGFVIRNRIARVEKDEKPSKSFLKFGKTARANSTIVALKDPDSSRTFKKMEELSNHAMQFYKTLYTKQDPNYEAINQLLESSVSKLSIRSREMCDSPLTLFEITQAIRQQKCNTSPGVDGITNEFYQEYEELLAPILLDVYNDWFKNEELQLSQKTGAITLIYKKGDRKDLQNYRPISLICCDLKILTTIFANRLQKIIVYKRYPFIRMISKSGFIKKKIYSGVCQGAPLMLFVKSTILLSIRLE
jgi:exonuclease III